MQFFPKDAAQAQKKSVRAIYAPHRVGLLFRIIHPKDEAQSS